MKDEQVHSESVVEQKFNSRTKEWNKSKRQDIQNVLNNLDRAGESKVKDKRKIEDEDGITNTKNKKTQEVIDPRHLVLDDTKKQEIIRSNKKEVKSVWYFVQGGSTDFRRCFKT